MDGQREGEYLSNPPSWVKWRAWEQKPHHLFIFRWVVCTSVQYEVLVPVHISLKRYIIRPWLHHLHPTIPQFSAQTEHWHRGYMRLHLFFVRNRCTTHGQLPPSSMAIVLLLSHPAFSTDRRYKDQRLCHVWAIPSSHYAILPPYQYLTTVCDLYTASKYPIYGIPPSRTFRCLAGVSNPPTLRHCSYSIVREENFYFHFYFIFASLTLTPSIP